MITVTLDDIQHNLPVYLDRVREGESLLVVEAGRPLAEIKPVGRGVLQRRPFGLCRGDFVVPDDFDSPLPEETLTVLPES